MLQPCFIPDFSSNHSVFHFQLRVHTVHTGCCCTSFTRIVKSFQALYCVSWSSIAFLYEQCRTPFQMYKLEFHWMTCSIIFLRIDICSFAPLPVVYPACSSQRCFSTFLEIRLIIIIPQKLACCWYENYSSLTET
jgi:hypothetical protein